MYWNMLQINDNIEQYFTIKNTTFGVQAYLHAVLIITAPF